MAYNVLKGTVEGSVDQHGDQEIKGCKTFHDVVSAAGFYNTEVEAAVATLNDIAIKEVIGTRQHSILTKGPTGTLIANRNVRVEGGVLLAKKICCENIEGSAELMSSIPVDRFAGKIDAHHLQLGAGLKEQRAQLRVKGSEGILVNSEGVGINLLPNGGLSFVHKKLVASPQNALSIQASGQNLQDDDLLVVQDVSRGDVRSTTLSNLYDNYINSKIPQAEGPKGALQLNGAPGFNASPDLIYEVPSSTLKINGALSALDATISTNLTCAGDLHCHGAVYKGITTVGVEVYEVNPNDYTILADTTKNKVKIVLPDPADNIGRVIVVKKVNSHKYKINSYVAEIESEAGNIDIFASVTLKMNSASKMLQSDGENWLSIGSTAS